MERVISVADLQRQAGEYVDRAATQHEPIIVESGGQRKAALISMEDYSELLRRQTEHRRAQHGVEFLLSIADLGNSGHLDISECTEEILATEIDPQRGWEQPE
jgi:prevent-host-death family protein